MSKLKIKLLELLLNNIYKYNKNECREKYMETVMDDLYSLIKWFTMQIRTVLDNIYEQTN